MSDETPGLKSSGRVAGWVLIVTTVLAISGMLHHPVGGGGTPDAMAESLARIARPARLVHGAMIGVEMLLLYALATHAERRGLERPGVMAGLVTYAAGAFAMLIPASLDGFIIPDLAVRALANSEMLAAFRPLVEFAFAVTMAFAKLATVLVSLGVFLFSVDLMQTRGAARWVGLLGAVMGLSIAIGVLSSAVALNRTGMTAVVAVWGVWYVALGVMLLSKRV